MHTLRASFSGAGAAGATLRDYHVVPAAEAPATSIRFTLSRYDWKHGTGSAGASATDAPHPDAAVTAWSLTPADKLAAVLCGRPLLPATEALEVTSIKKHTLRLRVAEGRSHTTASIAVNISALLKVRSRPITHVVGTWGLTS